MKISLLLLLMIFLVAGCENDLVNNPGPVNPLPDTDLRLDGSLNQLPIDLLSTEPIAIFVNDEGEENRFKIDYTREMGDRTFIGTPYKAEKLRADYQEVNPGGLFTLGISAKIEYDPSKQISETLGANLLTAYNNGFIPFLTIDNHGNVSFGSTLEVIEIAGHTFHNIYSNYILPTDFNSFTKIYYTKELGIVGYEGLEGQMWALDRYEN